MSTHRVDQTRLDTAARGRGGRDPGTYDVPADSSLSSDPAIVPHRRAKRLSLTSTYQQSIASIDIQISSLGQYLTRNTN